MTEQQTQETGAPPPQPAVNWAPTAPAQAQVPGSASLVYADVLTRFIALIIDGIILAIVSVVITGILYGIIGQPVNFNFATGAVSFNFLPLIVGTIVGLAISAAYYVYTWTTMRASPGHKILGMQIGNFPDGRTLTQQQAIRRWAVLFAPFSVAQIFNVIPTLGMLVGLATIGYAIYLLYTTATSPTKRGFHDLFANTVVVKAARTV